MKKKDFIVLRSLTLKERRFVLHNCLSILQLLLLIRKMECLKSFSFLLICIEDSLNIITMLIVIIFSFINLGKFLSGWMNFQVVSRD